MNHTVLSGRLTADILSRSVKEDKTVQSFTIASNGNGQHTSFVPVEAWDMDHLPKYLKKGSRVLVQGSLRENKWKAKGGESRSRLVLTARQVEFIDTPATSGEAAG